MVEGPGSPTTAPGPTRIEEAVKHADTAEKELASLKAGFFPVDFGLDLAVEKEICLFERVIMDLSGAPGFVVDGEQRQ